MDNETARLRFAGQDVARLATVSADGFPHLVPIVFAVVDSVIYTAVDGKPKKSTKLKRLANIDQTGKVSVLTDHYEFDWNALWWVRADGSARIIDAADPEGIAAVQALVAKYRHYRDDSNLTPRGQVVAIDVRSWHCWEAAR